MTFKLKLGTTILVMVVGVSSMAFVRSLRSPRVEKRRFIDGVTLRQEARRCDGGCLAPLACIGPTRVGGQEAWCLLACGEGSPCPAGYRCEASFDAGVCVDGEIEACESGVSERVLSNTASCRANFEKQCATSLGVVVGPQLRRDLDGVEGICRILPATDVSLVVELGPASEGSPLRRATASMMTARGGTLMCGACVWHLDGGAEWTEE